MSLDTQEMMNAVGFSEAQRRRYLLLEEQGRRDDCVRMLRCRRSELVDALHEAQRPIDVVDYVICELGRSS